MVEYTTNLNLVKPAYDEFADVSAINNNMDIIDEAIKDLDNSTLAQRVTDLENDKAPNAHSSATSEYGAASTTLYGHTKLYSGIDSDSESLAATPKAVKAAAEDGKYIVAPDSTKYFWGIDDTGMYYKTDAEAGIYVAKRTELDVKLSIPERITTGTTIEIIDNTEYELTDVTTLTLTYPTGKFECWLKITTASEGTITITLPSSSYIGYTPIFGNGETWEISIKDGVVIAQKVGSGA